MKGRRPLHLVSLLGLGLKGIHQKPEIRFFEPYELLDLECKVFGIDVTCTFE